MRKSHGVAFRTAPQFTDLWKRRIPQASFDQCAAVGVQHPSKPGQPSANPKGRPKKPTNELAKVIRNQAIADVKAAAKEHTAEAIKTLVTVMKNERAPAAASVTAALGIIDRGWGRPEQTVNANVSIFDQMSDDEQKHLLAALAALKAQDEDRPETLN